MDFKVVIPRKYSISTFSKWSRGWYREVNILKQWVNNFCPNFIWTIDIKESLQVLQSTFLIWSRDWYWKVDILIEWLDTFYSGFIVHDFGKGFYLVYWLVMQVYFIWFWMFSVEYLTEERLPQCFEAAECLCIVVLTSILRLL